MASISLDRVEVSSLGSITDLHQMPPRNATLSTE